MSHNGFFRLFPCPAVLWHRVIYYVYFIPTLTTKSSLKSYYSYFSLLTQCSIVMAKGFTWPICVLIGKGTRFKERLYSSFSSIWHALYSNWLTFDTVCPMSVIRKIDQSHASVLNFSAQKCDWISERHIGFLLNPDGINDVRNMRIYFDFQGDCKIRWTNEFNSEYNTRSK